MSSSRLSERIGVAAVLAPISGNNTTKSTTYADITKWRKVAFIATVGVTDCLVDVKLQAATDSSGSGVVDITGAVATQLSATDDGKTVIIEISDDHLQVLLGSTFVWVKALLTISNATAALVACVGLGGDLRFASAADSDVTTVSQIVAL